jgi:hypothetical protein
LSEGRITHNATSADIFGLELELRFNEDERIAPFFKKREGGW